MKIAIVGGGSMGLAMYQRLSKVFSPDDIWLCDPHSEKREHAKQSCTDVAKIKTQVNAVIFAIKPQAFHKWTMPLENHLILSIMTGINLKSLEKQTGSKKVVRSMPNLALKIGESVTGWIAAPSVSEKDKKLARSLFSAFGYEVELDQEEKIDKLTAISGSGPAYFFYFCECMIQKAKEYGFKEEEAKQMVMQTLKGASALLEEVRGEATEIRKKVTSEKGTTHAAITTFDREQMPQIISNALDAARKRAEELSL